MRGYSTLEMNVFNLGPKKIYTIMFMGLVFMADHDYCWNIYEFIHGWRTMGYPVDQTFIDIFEAHNVPVFNPGDVDEDGSINVLDVVYIINYIYKNGPAPNNPSSADVQTGILPYRI